MLDDIILNDEQLSISKIVKKINDSIDLTKCGKLTVNIVQELLIENNLLEVYINSNNEERKRPTYRGNEMGIREVNRISSFGKEYSVNMYDLNVQKYIIKLLLSKYDN